jgi:uncharacterized DUF497 family protein
MCFSDIFFLNIDIGCLKPNAGGGKMQYGRKEGGSRCPLSMRDLDNSDLCTLLCILEVRVAMFSLLDKTFTWDEAKSRENLKKHGLTLSEAVSVFRDPFLVVRYDETHSSIEEFRWKGIGLLGNALLLSVIFIEQQDQIIHLISARQASHKEKEDYRENIRQIFGA